MPSFPDSAVLILLVLLLFGPKKLPELARQFGKLMADFRRASNEFRSQMEDELRISEQADARSRSPPPKPQLPQPLPSKPPRTPLNRSMPSPFTPTRVSLRSIPRSNPPPTIHSIRWNISRANPRTIPCPNRSTNRLRIPRPRLSRPQPHSPLQPPAS